MYSNTSIETSSTVPKEPTRNVHFQMCQSPLVTPRSPMQSSLSGCEKGIHQQEFQGLSRNSGIQMQPGPVMGPGLPTLIELSGLPSHQIPSILSEGSGFQVPIGPMAQSEKCCDKQSCPVAPRKWCKECIVYSKDQKCLLQEHFDQCKYPDLEQHMALALQIGVTEYKIQVYASLFSLSPTPKGSPSQLVT